MASPYEEVIRKNVEKYGADIVKNLNERLMRLKREFVRMRKRLQRLEKIARLMTMLSMELVQLVRLEEVSLAEKDLEKDIERKLEAYSSGPMHDTLYLCTLMNNKVKNLALAVSHRYGSLTSVVGARFSTKVRPILIDVIERGRALLQRILKLALEQGLGGRIRENINRYIEVIEDLDFIPGSSLIEPVKCVVKYRGVDRPIEIDLCSYGIRSFITMILACIVAEQEKNSVILIEEPENTLHLGLIRKLSEALVEFSEKNVQIILSTHNIQLVRELIHTLSKREKDLNTLSIVAVKRDHITGKTTIINYTGEETELNIERLGYDLIQVI
ncbi:MAG: ATP-binding protein [Crenarchaeota archaeon]|nr:ATP-binding protein [Thermoproteota archaeon]